MSTLVRTETGKDQRGNKFLTNTYESFTEITPSPGVNSYSITQNDGVYTLVETYTEQVPDPGGGGGGTTFPDIWSLDITTTSEPIETHPVFRLTMSAEEMANWTAWKQGRADATDPGTSTNPAVQNLYLRYNRGQVDYLAARIVLKHQKVYVAPPSMAGVGLALNDIDGNPFTFSSAVNFLVTGATCVQEGGNYRVTMEYLTSSFGKWDSYLYGP
jgi:hypothetical protein